MSKTVPNTRIPNVMVSLRDRGDTARKPLTGCDLGTAVTHGPR